MASASSIARLHRNPPQLRHNCQQPAQFKSDTVADSEPSLLEMQQRYWASMPVRRRLLPRLAAPPMSNSVMPASVPTGRNSFADVAMRESAMQMRATLARRFSQQARGGGAGHQPLMRIQL